MGEGILYGAIFLISFLIYLSILIWIESYSAKEKTNKGSGKSEVQCRTLTYTELLDSEEWRRKREEILSRDGHRCRWCGSDENLQVHHKYYSRYPDGRKVNPWNYPNDALITLCDSCHKKAHKKRIKVYYRRYCDNY